METLSPPPSVVPSVERPKTPASGGSEGASIVDWQNRARFSPSLVEKYISLGVIGWAKLMGVERFLIQAEPL